MIASEPRACPVCNACCPRNHCKLDAVQFVRCDACCSIYHGTEPDWDRINQIYASSYHDARGHAGDPHIERVKRLTTLKYLDAIERLGCGGRRMLEVGCSTGAALEVAATAGWEVDGLELAEESAAIARTRPGVNTVYTGRLEEADLDGRTYDAIVLFDVIEHIDPPDAALERIEKLLRPNGLLLMVTPDAGSASARMLGARWPHLIMEHVVLFSRRGMRIALTKAGLTTERLRFAWKYVNLNMLVRHATIHPHVAFSGFLRLMGRATPSALLQAAVPFNVGEFCVMARKQG